ncbi:mitochondrial ribonuclease P catalytic subunit isoform X2 [Cylas formicarius]|uniref:mitochondrial ribonuclease P catalytic subunit isoform X2 n=1 Tax=Cylas formicarius TaxID=197179 RepID=UPI0029586FBD|nr:mitochondrial ribonuclease P catalytic subunit isoform X2 [Cylas formicarius]
MFSNTFRMKLTTNRLKYVYRHLSAHKNAKMQHVTKQQNMLHSIIENLGGSTEQNWQKIRKEILEHQDNNGKYTEMNIDSNVITCCTSLSEYSLGENYFKYLSTENRQPNLATLGNFMKLLYFKNRSKLSKTEEDYILKIFREVRNKYKVLDSITLNNLALAVSLTKEWRKCLDMLVEIKLLEELLAQDKTPYSIVYEAYLNNVRRLRKRENIKLKLEQLFEFLRENEIICGQDIVPNILELCGANGTKTTVNYRGVCDHCKNKLEELILSDEEFHALREALVKKVIIGKDLFLKTNPAELEKFKNFIQNMGKFDVVLDGLNIAYSAGNKGPNVYPQLIRSVVQHFVDKNKTVLMLGRVHMTNWNKYHWNYIKQHSSIFLTQNISHDDPYLLYCALNSGKDTIVVTRDLMRGHKFLLENLRLKKLFQRWLRQRQYNLVTVKENGRPIFRAPPPFSAIAQKVNEVWHVPIVSSTESSTDNFHSKWLCLDIR